MKRTKVVIFGTGDFAELVHYYLEKDERYDVVGFTESAPKNRQFKELIVVPFQCIEDVFPPNEFKMFIAVGYSQQNLAREHFYKLAKAKGYDLLTYVHPDAIIADDVPIGDNCFIFERNNIQPFVTIGNNVIMWSGNHIGHHSKIKDHVFISSHVVVSGNCVIWDNCFLGVNSTLVDGVTLNIGITLGAGAVVIKDLNVTGTYVGVPARRLDNGL